MGLAVKRHDLILKTCYVKVRLGSLESSAELLDFVFELRVPLVEGYFAATVNACKELARCITWSKQCIIGSKHCVLLRGLALSERM
jgi:hypothetical protein